MFNKELQKKLDTTSKKLLKCLDFLKELQKLNEAMTDFKIIKNQEYFKIEKFLKEMEKEK